MKRRRLIALIAFFTVVGLLLIAGVGGVLVMRSDLPRNFIQARLQAGMTGKVYVGRISGNPFAEITVDSFAIRDSAGALLVSTGRVTGDFDIRDILDQRIYLRHVTAEHPLVHIQQLKDGWNYQLGKNRGRSGPKGPKVGRAWGDYFVLDSVRARDVTFILSLRWEPDASLRGAKRDSAIRYEMSRRDRRIERSDRTGTGFARTYIWSKGGGLLAHVRLSDPDSNKTHGMEIQIADMDVNEFDPPFLFRNLQGNVRRLGDSVWFDLARFELPGSRGSARGKIVWGSDLPIRYDIAVRADTVSLADVAWVYPTLPTTGGGRMLLDISNKRDLRVMDYRIHSMDVRSTKSHLIGEMTFGVGRPVLEVRNVSLKAEPVDFDLLRVLAGGPFPIDWQGQIYGDVRASGGLLDEFEVESARGEWRDTRIPGAVSRLSGSGGLNIVRPAFTEFHAFDVDVGSLDLRSIERLFPAFPKLGGTIAGRATLDSVWTDVRFSDADITHRDGPGTPSRFTGFGRVTDGKPYITYDVNLFADPISFDMLARSFPKLTLRGLAAGPIAIQGQSPDLKIEANLTSQSGNFRFAGNIDIDSLGGYAARGSGVVRNLDLRGLLARRDAVSTSLSGLFDLDVRGSSKSSIIGSATIRADSSRYDRLDLAPSRATIRFENGRVITNDPVVVNSPLGQLSIVGALGLPGGNTDSANVEVSIPSLAALRPFFGDTTKADSIRGGLKLTGVARGRLDSLFLKGGFAGDSLFLKGLSASQVTGTFDLADVLRSPHGPIEVRLDSARVLGMAFDTLAGLIGVLDSSRAEFTVNGSNVEGDSLRLLSRGLWSVFGPRTSLRVDQFDLAFGAARWALEMPTTFAFDTSMFRVDTLSLVNGRGARVGLAAMVPNAGDANISLLARQVPLADFNRVSGVMTAPLSGLGDFEARVSGTKDAPVISVSTALDSVAISDVRIGRLLGTARYANQRAGFAANIFQGATQVFHAEGDSLPLAVKLFGYDTLPGAVRVRASADGADFTLAQIALTDLVGNLTGRMFGSMSIDGTWAKTNMVANAALVGGGMSIDTLGVALSNMYGRVRFANDTLVVDSVRAYSGGDRNWGDVRGTVSFRNWALSGFNLQMEMRDFQAYNRVELATIYARTDSGPITLRGQVVQVRPDSSVIKDTLRGIIQVDRGSIYLPDPKLVNKQFSQAIDGAIDGPGLRRAAQSRSLYERATQELAADLRVHLGGAFNLSARYADIPLSGDLRIVPVTMTDVARFSTDITSRLAPEGTINADRGTYTLELDPLSRTFAVERGGTITFDRDAQWNGVMNVSARYTVRKPGQPDIPIIAEVTERLLAPKVSLRSEASFPISDSDMLSYLFTGEPGWDLLGQFDRTRGTASLVSTLLTPVATSAAADALKKRLGGWVDQLRFESANLDAANAGEGDDIFSRTLFSSRVLGEKEFLDGRGLLSVSTGFCGFNSAYRQQVGQGFGRSFADLVGGALSWRLRSTQSSGSSVQFSSEPATSAQLCSPGFSGSQGIAATPRQFSLSFPFFWRW